MVGVVKYWARSRTLALSLTLTPPSVYRLLTLDKMTSTTKCSSHIT